jgi:hypothetical protein
MRLTEADSLRLQNALQKAFVDTGSYTRENSMGDINSSLAKITTENETNEEPIIRGKFKKSDITDILSNKKSKSKMNLPIGKLFSFGKKTEGETKEVTGAGSAGGFTGPLFTTTKKEMQEKWSQKYKDSIDCDNPKGFSQRAHCQGKKKKQTNESEFKAPKLTMFSDEAPKNIKPKKDTQKIEATEATGAASAGSYVTTAAWAKSTSKKDWRGKSKTQIPGGAFVQVKAKCKKFPYCNQGDINALNITKPKKKKIKESDEIFKKLSEKHNIDENLVRKIINMELGNRK